MMMPIIAYYLELPDGRVVDKLPSDQPFEQNLYKNRFDLHPGWVDDIS